MVSKNKLLIFGFLFLLILLPIVNAQPPFEERPTLIEGYFIEIPQQQFLKVRDDFTFFFHVFNQSNGLPLTNLDSVECEFNLHNSSSNLILTDTNLSFDPTTVAFFIEVEGAILLTNPGSYTYVTHCNSTAFGGVVSVNLEVTNTGFSLDTQQSLIVLGLIIVLLFLTGAFLFFGEKMETTSVKVFLIALGSLFFLLTLGFSINAIKELMLLGSVFSGMFVNLYRLFLILISGGMIAIILYMITVAVTAFKKSRGVLDDED